MKPTVPGLYCAALGLVRYFKGPRKRALKRVWKLAHFVRHWPDIPSVWSAAAFTALLLCAMAMLPPVVPRKSRRNASRTPE